MVFYLLHIGSAKQNAVPATSWMNGTIVEGRSIGIFRAMSSPAGTTSGECQEQGFLFLTQSQTC